MGHPSKLARLRARNKLRRERLKARKHRKNMHNCQVCGKPDNEKAMAFRNMPWCSENHRKIVQKDAPRKTY